MQTDVITFWLAAFSAVSIILMNISAAYKNKTGSSKDQGELSVMLTDAAKDLIDPLTRRIDQLVIDVAAKNKEIVGLKLEISGMKSEILQMTGMIKDRDLKIDLYESRIKDLEIDVRRLTDENIALRNASKE